MLIMTLGITIIETLNNTKLNLNGIPFGVLMDDNILSIKNKIFLSMQKTEDKILYNPNFTKLEIKKDLTYKLLANNNCLLNYYESPLPIDPVIYVTSIINIINNKISDIYTFYNKGENGKTELFKELSSDFTDITIDDIDFLIKNKFYNYLISENLQIISETEKENLKRDIYDYIQNTIKSNWINNTNSFNEENEYLESFYNLSYADKNFNYEINEDNSPSFIYTNISFSVKNDFDVKDKFLNTQNIFNILELSDDIPFIAYNTSSKKDPIIKIYNKLVDSIPKDTIKSWILNENKKKNKITYKKIKGLVLKHRFTFQNTNDPYYMTIEILDNGSISIKTTFDQEDDKRSIVEILDIIVKIINTIINKFDTLFGIYSKSKRLLPIIKEQILIDSTNAILTTEELVQKDKFPLSDLGVQKFFTAKMINNIEILSFYYTKSCKEITDDDYEKLGLTINIKDNPYKKDSSLLYIFGASSISQLETIIYEILISNEIGKGESEDALFSDIEEEYEQKIKKKSNIKQIRKYNPSIVNPIKCQKERQPITENNENYDSKMNYEDYRILNYQDTKYICTGDQYKYPGFTPANILCCFQKKGEGILRNIGDPYLLEIIVQPSNFFIDVSHENKTFKTYVIKMISDMNKDSLEQPYYFLDAEKGVLVHIHNKDLINIIRQNEISKDNENESIWLQPTKLYNLIHSNGSLQTTSCENKVDFTNRKNNNLNGPCEKHTTSKIFGYTKNSFPCCFETTPKSYVQIEQISKENPYLITTNKPLEPKRKGILPSQLHVLLNELVIENSKGAIIRWGVEQNKFSFLNCIIEALGDKIGLNTTTFGLRKFITSYLEKNTVDFHKLNNGTIYSKYGSLQNYIKAINDVENPIQWLELVDIIQRSLQCNIMIINIPLIKTKTTEKEDYNNMKILCLPVKTNISNPYVFLLKRINSFELIVRDSQIIWAQSKLQLKKNIKSIVTYQFIHDKNANPKTNIVNFFVEYYKSSCVKENKYPNNFDYTELYDVSTLLSIIKGTPHDIYFQIINSFNKVIMIVTKRGLIIPVKENIIIDKIPKIHLEIFIEKNKAVDINKLEKLIDEFNALPNITFKMSIKGIVKGNYTTTPQAPTQATTTQVTTQAPTQAATNKPFLSFKELNDVLNENLIEIPFTNTEIIDKDLILSKRKKREILFNIECENDIDYIDYIDKEKLDPTLLKKYDFSLENIKGDGNCQYRAIAKVIYGDQEMYKDVKNKMKKELDLLYTQDSDFFEYLPEDYMKEEFWGDHISLIALSNTFTDYCFNVYTLCKKNNEIFLSGTKIIEDCNRRFDCNLLYTGENHYDALL